MTTTRLIAIAVIYLVSALAWGTLGASLVARTGESDARLGREVTQLWGGRHRQAAPRVWVERPREVTEQVPVSQHESSASTWKSVTRTVVDQAPVRLDKSRIAVDLGLAHRQKGLLWYDTYRVGFHGRYAAINPDAVERTVGVEFRFPSADALYDGFDFRVNGSPAPPADLSKGITTRVAVPPGGQVEIEIRYRSRGLDDWAYAFAETGVGEVSDFELVATTNVRGVDFPAGSVSPSEEAPIPGGWRLTWRFDHLVTGQHIGIDLPNLQNPGPLAARITAFAPIALLFFLAVTIVVGVLGGFSLHPMNYAFVSAGFFAFHLLLAYLVDHISIHLAFAISSAVSVLLVVSYLRLVAGTRFAVARAGLAQLIFLVLFSYSFFFEGYAGLTIAIGAVLTLFVLMQATARVDWGSVFSARAGREA